MDKRTKKLIDGCTALAVRTTTSKLDQRLFNEIIAYLMALDRMSHAPTRRQKLAARADKITAGLALISLLNGIDEQRDQSKAPH